MTLNLKVLDEGEIEQIRATALRVLHKKGLRFTVPEIRSIFKSHGFTITDSDIVHITPDDLDAALKTAPRFFTRRGASPSKDVQIGKGPTKYAIGSVPIWIIERDPEIIRRPATYPDFKNFTLLSEELSSYDIGNPVVQPQEISEKVMHALWNRNCSVRMTKPVCCWYGTSFETANEGLEILRLASGGMEQLRESKRWAITPCPDSAFQWGKSAIGSMVMAKADVPIDILPMPFLGSMYPVTLAGALVQSTVETLGIVVLAQLVRPGCPVLFAPSYGGIMDMATGGHSFGAPESALFASAAVEIGHSFGLPTNMMQGTSDSKLPDEQAALEKTLTYLLSDLSGADCVTMAGALLDFALSASYEQLIIEDEIIKWTRRISKGVNVDKESLAEEEIMNLPIGGNYLESEHTLKHFKKELTFTTLIDRRTWDAWYNDGALDIVKRAQLTVKDIISGTKLPLGVNEKQKKDVDEFVAGICNKHGIDPEPLLY